MTLFFTNILKNDPLHLDVIKEKMQWFYGTWDAARLEGLLQSQVLFM